MPTIISRNQTFADVEAVTSSKAAPNGIASLNGSSLVVQNPASATTTPGASAIPLANGSGKLAAGWGGAASSLATLNGSSQVVERLSYEGTASGVATLNGSSAVVQEPASKAQANGIASLNGSSLVVQNPANAQTLAAPNKIPLSNGSGVLDDNFLNFSLPRWVKFTKTFSDLSFAGLSNDIELFSLVAGGVIHSVKIKHSVAFSGGAIASYTVSVGISGNLTKYTSAFDVFQAVSNTTFQLSNTLGSENHGAATSIRLAAVSTGANLDAATTGSVDIWVLVSTAV